MLRGGVLSFLVPRFGGRSSTRRRRIRRSEVVVDGVEHGVLGFG
jgi:hypothetical protein